MSVRIAFVGPLPPPVHGFSAACEVMLNRCRALASTEIFDRGPRQAGIRGWLSQSAKALGYFPRYLGLRGQRAGDTVLYLALSGGNGQLIDALYVLSARLLGHRIFVHHHSFAYIDQPGRLNRVLFRLLQHATHIVLSAGMGRSLSKLYGLEPGRIRVVSNAALFPAMAATEPGAAGRGLLRIGYLSNITFEKGIVEFFEVLNLLQARGVAYQARIAGPVAPAVKPTFDRMLAAASHVEHLGPLYEEAKDRFFRELDVMLFPTKYINEAEPLVIHEALRAGVFTIACDRGAIAEILDNGAGLALPEREFVESAARWLAQASSEPASLGDTRRSCREQALSIQKRAAVELEHLLQTMSTVQPTTGV